MEKEKIHNQEILDKIKKAVIDSQNVPVTQSDPDAILAEYLNYTQTLLEIGGTCQSVSHEKLQCFVPPNMSGIASDLINHEADELEDRITEESSGIFGGSSSEVIENIRNNRGSLSSSSIVKSAGIDGDTSPAATLVSNYGSFGPGGYSLLQEMMAESNVEIDQTVLMNYILKWCEEMDKIEKLRSSALSIAQRASGVVLGPGPIQTSNIQKYSVSGQWLAMSSLDPTPELEESIINDWVSVANSCPP